MMPLVAKMRRILRLITPELPRKRVLLALGYYDQRIHRGAARFAREAKWILDTHMAHYGVVPTHWKGDGIITSLYPNRPDLTELAFSSRVPVVDLADNVEFPLPRVVHEDWQIGRLAAEHLVERGFQDFAFLKYTDSFDIRQRAEGFAACVRKAGRALHVLDWHAFSRTPRGRGIACFDWLTRRIQRLPKPIGVMVQSDNKAIFLLNICEAAGLKVPEQVAVVGVDNDELACEFAPVPLSSVDSSLEDLAYAGAQLLGELIEGRPAPSEPLRVAPKGVVTRESSDILAVNHDEVATALHYIWRHYREPIRVEHVLAAQSMSRCGLIRAFEKHIGHSIGHEIVRKRVELAQKLLVSTSDKIRVIALEAGFSSSEHLSRAFMRVRGQTPSDYRKDFSSSRTRRSASWTRLTASR
jgi:LacI family transcriptional regulator, galactose operon repressor